MRQDTNKACLSAISPKSLIHGAADGQVVHGHLSKSALGSKLRNIIICMRIDKLVSNLGVDDEETSERDACVLDQDAVLLGDLLVEVRGQGVVEATKTALLAGEVDPGEVGEVGVGAHADHLAVDVLGLRIEIEVMPRFPILTRIGKRTLNSWILSENAIISVGHTKVKSRG